MLKSIFNGIGNTIRGIGLIGGSLIMGVLYGLLGIFIYWAIKIFSTAGVSGEVITNEYLLEGWKFIFITHNDISQLVCFGVFALGGALKVLSPDKKEYSE